MMRWHRLCAACAAVLLIYIVFTGTGIELADMRALVTHAPETDPDMLMMRQHIDGPPNYAVVTAPDYTAPSLPAGIDYATSIGKAASLGRAAVPGAELRMVELRMAEGKLAGNVRMGSQQLIFDLATGVALPSRDLPPPPTPRDFPGSTRAAFKFLHRFNYLGQLGTGLNLVAGIAFSILIVTGLLHYTRLYKARAKMKRQALLWRGGGWWRDLHRGVAVCASLLVVWLTVTGLLLSIDNVGAFVHGFIHGRPIGTDPFAGDFSAPLNDADLPGMTKSTLSAFHRAEPDTGVKVFQLRDFAGYAQGVVVAADRNTTQMVFNTVNGARMTMHETGYPELGFPSGWEWHQRLKQFHRGDMFGMPGRWLDTLGALSLVYMSVSGVVMYYQLWRRRKKAGRAAFVWS